MKRSVLIALCILGTASLASAQLAGSVGLFADVDGTECNIVNPGGGMVTVHILHVNHDGATAAMFQIVDGGSGWFEGAYTKPAAMTTIGAPMTGISIGYGVPCAAAPTYLGNQAFFASVAAPACTYLSVVPHPDALTGLIEGVDCAQTKTFPTGGVAVVNSDGSCDCSTPVEETTWGGIKSLYQ
jgi:hypothetical protein